MGLNPRLDRVGISDGQGIRNACVATFYERFEEAFVREGRPLALALHDATEATRIAGALAEAQRGGKVVELG